MSIRDGKCPECGSSEVRSKSAVSSDIYIPGWLDGESISFIAYVCLDCGALRTYVEDQRILGKLGKKWDKVRVESR